MTGARLLVLDPGSAMGSNLIRSLKAGDGSLFIIGCGRSRFFLKKSEADRNYLLPEASQEFLPALRRIIETEQVDLVVPTSDSDVFTISELRNKLRCRTFLPRKSVIRRCNDKYYLTQFLRRRGIPAPLTYPIIKAGDIELSFRRFKSGSLLWCRIRGGAGSYGAIPVRTPEQVRSWIEYWERMRGVPRSSFTLSEYLPGRDYCVQCLWDNGTLVLAKMAERIVYLDNGSPSGVSSMPSLARTAYDDKVIDASVRGIRAVDNRASGVYFVDIKENAKREPCITEINAGRFATMTNLHDLTGRHNMAVTYVRLGLGKPTYISNPRDYAEGYYLVRSVDTLPCLVHKSSLFTGIAAAFD
jgi:carbamoylphosphate synthase large subunit